MPPQPFNAKSEFDKKFNWFHADGKPWDSREEMLAFLSLVEEKAREKVWLENTIIIQQSPQNIEVCGFCSNTGRIKNPDANGKPCICPNGKSLK